MRHMHLMKSLLRSGLCLTLIAIALSASSLARASGSEQLKAFIAETHSARASFTQSVLGKSGRKAQVSTGSFLLQRPGHFRLQYDKPYAQLLVSDGDKLWVYDADLNQVTVKTLGQALGASPAALLAGAAEMEKNFLLSDVGSKDGIDWVDAKPRAQDNGFQEVRLGFRDNLPQVLEVRDNFGQTTTLLFSRFERNAKIDARAFRFVPPAGADVLKE